MSTERTSLRLTELGVASFIAWLLMDFVPGGETRWICLAAAITPLAVGAVLWFRSVSADDP